MQPPSIQIHFLQGLIFHLYIYVYIHMRYHITYRVSAPIGTSEEKTPKNRLTETLEPLNQNIGAPNLSVAIKPILSVLYSSWLLSTHTRSRNQNSTIHITLLLQLNAAQKILVHLLHGRYDGLAVSLKSREMCFSHGIRSRIDCFFFCHK